tara:strand:+ start:471 stop:1637 length:1167 start_codon:yes stop_codon:yes gene_type:complete
MKLHESVKDKRTIERFKTLESELNRVHNHFYDYSESIYINSKTKFKYKCPNHGEQEITSTGHLRGSRCKFCYYETSGSYHKFDKKKFINKSIEVHGDKYDYSKVEYKNIHTKVIITCPEHGDFSQSPNNHQKGHGCIECSGTKQRTTKEFIDESKIIHGDTYDYSKVDYSSLRNRVTIVCSIHGEFKQHPSNHLKGHGCEKCSFKLISDVKSFSKKEFIEKSKKIHGDKYNYEKVDYKTMVVDVIIGCKEHGDFTQQPYIHSVGSGYPQCSPGGFHINKQSIFYIRKIELNGKIGLKYGITNQLDGNRENQQKRGMKEFDSFETIFKSPIFETGEKVLELENLIKDKFGLKGYFTSEEMKDGFTETILYNKQNLEYLKSVYESKMKNT